MSYSRIGSHSDIAARNDVMRLLRGDHERVLQEFREFERLESLHAGQACERVAQRTFAELKVLAGVEQQLFYPAVHDAIAGTDLIDQSQIEHARIQRVITELEAVEPGHAAYWRRFRTLGEYVRRHVEDEEGELFPMLSCVPLDWERLYEAMTSRRAELAEDLGVAHAPPLQRSRDIDLAPNDGAHYHDDDELALAIER
jgi:hypothetical protein